MDRSLSEPAVLVLLGTALLIAAFAARRLQGRGFRIRLESTVMGHAWVAAREAEDAAMARWGDINKRSRPAVGRTVRKLPTAQRPDMPFPPAPPSDATHQAALRH